MKIGTDNVCYETLQNISISPIPVKMITPYSEIYGKMLFGLHFPHLFHFIPASMREMHKSFQKVNPKWIDYTIGQVKEIAPIISENKEETKENIIDFVNSGGINMFVLHKNGEFCGQFEIIGN